jgi:hypothetical protein
MSVGASVDALDLEVLAGEFGKSGSPVGYAGDFNNEGDVDGNGDIDGSDLWSFIAGGSFADIGSFAASFGRTNCP